MNEVRKKSKSLQKLAEKIIKNNPQFAFIEENGIKVIYLESNLEKRAKGGIVHGECEKIPDKYKWAIKADFSITFFILNNLNFTNKQKEILMKHELMHIGISENGNLQIVPHDVEDFYDILQEHGLTWNFS